MPFRSVVVAILPMFVVACGHSAPAPIPATSISRADLGDRWPFIVEKGELRCEMKGPPDLQRQLVIFRANSIDYGVNGSAKGFGGFASTDAIVRRRQTNAPPKNLVDRLSESTRRGIFEKLVACEDKFDDDTEAAARRKCKAAAMLPAKVTQSDAAKITAEGVALSWPPLSPPSPMDVGPIIQRGLALCGR